MVNDAISNDIEFSAVVQVFVNSVTTREYDSIEQHNVANLELSNVGFAQGGAQPDNIGCGQCEIRNFFLLLEFVGGLIQPFNDIAVDIQHDAAPPVCPAHIGDGYKEGSRQTIQF